jgi:hypothetical protein
MTHCALAVGGERKSANPKAHIARAIGNRDLWSHETGIIGFPPHFLPTFPPARRSGSREMAGERFGWEGGFLTFDREVPDVKRVGTLLSGPAPRSGYAPPQRALCPRASMCTKGPWAGVAVYKPTPPTSSG